MNPNDLTAPSQRRAWFLDQLATDTPARNQTTFTTLRGTIDPARLQEALKLVLERHPSLRASFTSDGSGALRAAIAPALLPGFTMVDLRGLTQAERGGRLATQARAFAAHRFELDCGPQVRAGLFVVADDEALLALTHHQSVLSSARADALRELVLRAYAGAPAPSLSDWGELSRRYLGWLEGEEAARRAKALGEALSRRAPALDLPSYRRRPASQPWRAESLAFALPPTLWARVRAFAAGAGVEPQVVLLAAWASVLHLYSGGQQVTLGLPAPFSEPFESERALHPIEHFSIVTPELDRDLDGVVAALAAELARNRQLEGVDFATLVDRLEVERSLARAAIFQAGFAVAQRGPLPGAPGLTAARAELHSGIARHEINLVVSPDQDACACALEYLVELYDEQTVRSLAAHFETLLRKALDAPGVALDRIELLGNLEREQILHEWNADALPYRKDLCIHQVAEEQARRTPDHVAVICDGRTLTYAELFARARALAVELRKIGVQREVVVGLHAEHSVELLVGIYGILIAGGAYVPLDPEYPEERLAFMLEDALVKALVVQGEPPPLAQKLGLPVVRLSGAAPSAGTPELPPGLEPNGDSLAYMIYTSGSTGKPKGVQITHRCVVDLANSFTRRPGLLETDVVTSVAPFTFDMSILTLFCPLTAGATILLATRDEGRDGAALGALLDRHGATIMKATPSTWRLVVEANWKGSDKITSMTGGELLTTELARRLRALCAHSWNHYGPTEATAICMMYPIVDLPDRPSIPMGRPMPNTQAYVLDPNLLPVPIGVPGELYISGDGLARGYARRPELTADRFIPNPFSSAPGARMYKTGDRVRYLPSGDLEFIGRFDNQIKFRGHRIELEEIEARIAASPGVGAVAVMVREDKADDQRLVAYVVPAEPTPPRFLDDIREHVRRSLPSYMLPSTFVVMERLPITARGKLDRRALPAPGAQDLAAALASRGPRTAPRNPTEARLVKIWEETLNTQGIGVNENFFELGGHSLVGMRVMTKIEESFGRRLPLSAIFRHPTIESLAPALTGASATAHVPYQLVTFNAGGTKPPLVLVHPMSGQITGIAHLAKALGPDQPVHAIEAWAEWGRDPISNIPEAAERYVELVLEAIPSGPFVLSAQSAGNWIAFEMAQRLRARGREPALFIIFDVGMPQRFLDYWAGAPMKESRYVAIAVANVIAQVGGAVAYQDVWSRHEEWVTMPPSVYWSKALAMVRESAVLPREHADEQILRFLKSLMWNALSFFGQGYVFRPYEGRAALIRSDQAHRPRAVYREGGWTVEQDPFRGWGKMITQPITGPYYIEGEDHDHWNVLYREPSAARAARTFLQAIADAGFAGRR